jgi:serine/threonine protein kinase
MCALRTGDERNQVKFGKFILHRRTGELYKAGIRVRVPDQSVKVLCLLLERPGDVITREEIRDRLWPNGTIVDFEHSVNNAIRRLRAALEDSGAEARFIETLPKHGYRFIFPCKCLSQTVAEQSGTGPDDQEDLSGKQFGPYQVLQKLGEGATASVYRGFDPRLSRFIALKFLAAHLLDRPSLRRRFEDEARLASTLNHPNVCTIYDVGNGERPFIAMELLEGSTLERLLRRGALPLALVLTYARQIAFALDAAHRRDITHRDVKPSNIFVTDRHLVKVTDFGIAQCPAPGSGSVPNSPEVFVAGTPGYIAPEHLNGKGAGARADIFAFGVVLHEMLMGRRPLIQRQPGVTATLQFVSHSECSKEVAYILDRILRSCLQTDPEERYASTEELLRDLGLAIDAFKIKPQPRKPFWAIRKVRRWGPDEKLPDHPGQLGPESQFRLDASSRGVSPPDLNFSANSTESSSPLPNGTVQLGSSLPTRPVHSAQIRMWALRGTAVVLVAAAAIYAIYPAKEPSHHSTPSLSITPLTSYPGNELQPGISPDGNQVAFAFNGDRSSNYHIYVKAIGSEEIRRLTAGPADDLSPSWSPDGQNIAFLRFLSDQSALVMVMPSAGGAERELAKLQIERDETELRVAWSPDGEWIATSDKETPLSALRLVLISATTGRKRRLVYRPQAEDADLSPSFSPDGRHLAFARHLSMAVADIYILEIPKEAGPATTAQPFTHWNRMNRSPVWSGDGKEIFFVGDEARIGPRIWRAPAFARGEARRVEQIGEGSTSISLSPSSKRLVYSKQIEDTNIWRLDLAHASGARSQIQRFVSQVIASTYQDGQPQYSPDGKRIAFQSDRSGDVEIWIEQRWVFSAPTDPAARQNQWVSAMVSQRQVHCFSFPAERLRQSLHDRGRNRLLPGTDDWYDE